MKNIVTTAAQYMVVAVTIERYVVICHKTVTVLKHHYYTAIVVIFSVTVNIPKFFEFKTSAATSILFENVTDDRDVAQEDLYINENESSYSYQTSSLGENRKLYLFNAAHEIFIIGFCLIVICYCNYRVWIQIVRSSVWKNR